MILLHVAGGLVLGAFGALALFTAWRYQRPDPARATALEVALWWTGHAVAWSSVTIVAGFLFGLASAGAWALVKGLPFVR